MGVLELKVPLYSNQVGVLDSIGLELLWMRRFNLTVTIQCNCNDYQ